MHEPWATGQKEMADDNQAMSLVQWIGDREVQVSLE